jgi:hypothetical protein
MLDDTAEIKEEIEDELSTSRYHENERSSVVSENINMMIEEDLNNSSSQHYSQSFSSSIHTYQSSIAK